MSSETCRYSIYLAGTSYDRNVEAERQAMELYGISLSMDHIWQRDSFSLGSHVTNKRDFSIFSGNAYYGECIDDEWFIVRILLEISSVWPDAAIRVWDDDDGEFILVESADHLPQWLTPENATHRVWLTQGKILVVKNSHYESPITEEDALRCLVSGETEYVAGIQETVQARISVPQYTHQTLVYLPEQAAKCFLSSGRFIAAATNAFYERDVSSMRHAREMKRFPLENAVLVPLKLTQTLYAQLQLQRYEPPKTVSEFWKRKNDSETFNRRRDMGLKLTSGLEMIYQERRHVRSHAAHEEEHLSSDVFRKLHHCGVPDPRSVYKCKRATDEPWSHQIDDVRTGPVRDLSGLNEDSLKQYEDNADFMSVDEAEIDPAMKAAVDDESGRIFRDQMTSITEKVEGFLNLQGDLDGALFADEQPSEDETSDASFDRTKGMIEEIDTHDWGSQSLLGKNKRAATRTMRPSMSKTSDEASNARRQDIFATLNNQSSEESGDRMAPLEPTNLHDGEGIEDDGSSEGILTSDDEDAQDEDGTDKLMEGELTEFLMFAAQELGLSEEDYRKIIQDRRKEGLFVPGISSSGPPVSKSDPYQVHGSSWSQFDEALQEMESKLKAEKWSRSVHNSGEEPNSNDGNVNNVQLDGSPDEAESTAMDLATSASSEAGLGGPAGALLGRLGFDVHRKIT